MMPRLICLVRRHQWHNGWDEEASDGVDLQALWCDEALRRDGGPWPHRRPRRRLFGPLKKRLEEKAATMARGRFLCRIGLPKWSRRPMARISLFRGPSGCGAG
jgi:hypothetical protein